MAEVEIGAHMYPLATPMSAIGPSSTQMGVVAPMTAASQTRPTTKHASPNPATQRGCARSVSRPT